jgi:hypothetical protein
MLEQAREREHAIQFRDRREPLHLQRDLFPKPEVIGI